MKIITLSLVLAGAVWSASLKTPQGSSLLDPITTAYQEKIRTDVPSPDNLSLNQIQVIGSHNSYKQPLDPPVYQMLKKADSTLVKAI
ncbi:MAG: Ca2+-dependent phosphoinositide-specific phospholipase C, partial [Bacteroidota bacterium]|nr:Ca2+-dependent phosphoinositide-specific phospholipase C [Bacteroidota bacterium]